MDIATMIQEYYVPIIIVGCFCVGYAIKQAGFIKDKFIPLIMLILGGMSGLIVNGLTYEAVVCGMASGLAATGLHQVFKQLSKDNDYTI